MKVKLKSNLEIEVTGIVALVPELKHFPEGTYGCKIKYLDGKVIHIQDMTTEQVHARIVEAKADFEPGKDFPDNLL